MIALLLALTLTGQVQTSSATVGRVLTPRETAIYRLTVTATADAERALVALTRCESDLIDARDASTRIPPPPEPPARGVAVWAVAVIAIGAGVVGAIGYGLLHPR